MTRRSAAVVWQLSEDEEMVVVDVDAPLRPFGFARRDAPRPDAVSPDPPPATEGRRRTLPPLPGVGFPATGKCGSSSS